MERIAVKTFTPIDVFQTTSFKQDALFFDKIYISADATTYVLGILDKNRTSAEQKEQVKLYCSEVDFLLEKGLLQDFNYDYDDFTCDTPDEEQNVKLYKEILNEIFSKDRFKLMNKTKLETHDAFVFQAGVDYATRLRALALKKHGLGNVVPILATKVNLIKPKPEQDVLSIVLNKFPTPDENTSWEQMFDFKSDSDSNLKRSALIHWINTVASSNRPINEIEEEYDYLYNQYKRHFELHKMKANSSTLEMIVSTGIDTVTSMQGIPTFFKNLFSLNKTRISLLEDELKLPGREIAYIHKANEVFK